MGLLDGLGGGVKGIVSNLGKTKAGQAAGKAGAFLKKNGGSLARRFANDDPSLITNPVKGFIGKFPIVSSVLKAAGDAKERKKKRDAEIEGLGADVVNAQMRNLRRGQEEPFPSSPNNASKIPRPPRRGATVDDVASYVSGLGEAIDKNAKVLHDTIRTGDRRSQARDAAMDAKQTAQAAVIANSMKKGFKVVNEGIAEKQQQPQQQGGIPQLSPEQINPEEEGGFSSSSEGGFLEKLLTGGVELFISAITRWAGPLILPVYLGFRKFGKFLLPQTQIIKWIANNFERIPDMISNLWDKIFNGIADMGDNLLTSFRASLPSWMPGSLSAKEATKHREDRARTKSLQTEAKKLRSSGENRMMYGYDEGFRDERNLENLEKSAIESSEKAISDMGENPPEVKKLVERLKGFGAYDDDGEIKAGFDVNSLSLEDLDALLDTKFKLYGFAGEQYKNLLGDPSTLNMTEKAYLLRLPAPTIFFKDDGFTIDSGKTQQDLAGKLMRVSSAFALMTNVGGEGKGRFLVRPPASRLFENGAVENQFDALAKNPKFTLTAISSDDELYDRYLGNALLKRTETPWGIGDEQVIVHNGIPYLIKEVEEAGATATGATEAVSAEGVEEAGMAEATNISETPATPQKVGAEEIYNQLYKDMMGEDLVENISDIKEAQEEAKNNPPKAITNNNTVIQPTEKTTEVRYVTDNYSGSSEDTGIG